MDILEFEESLEKDEPPQELATELKALWKAAKGSWNEAHRLVQDDTGSDAAWVHAYLHRVEGDLSNASYWYRKAGKKTETGSLDAEWKSIVSALLSD